MPRVLASCWNNLCETSTLPFARQKVSPRVSWSVDTTPSLTQEAGSAVSSAILFRWEWQVGKSGHQLFFSTGIVWRVAPKSGTPAYVPLLQQRLHIGAIRMWALYIGQVHVSERLYPEHRAAQVYWVQQESRFLIQSITGWAEVLSLDRQHLIFMLHGFHKIKAS